MSCSNYPKFCCQTAGSEINMQEFRRISRLVKPIEAKEEFYVETDITKKMISVGKSGTKITLTAGQVKTLTEILNHQVQLLSDM